MAVPAELLATLERGLNALVDARLRSKAECAALDGRTVAVEWRELGLTLCFTARGERLEVRGTGEPEATIRGTLPAFARAMMADAHGAPPGIEIEGDAPLARDFQALLRGLEFDWEEHLSRVVGDAAARGLGNALRGFAAWGRFAGERLSRDLVEYLQRETRDLPHRAEVETFLRGVDAARADVDRVEARLKRLADTAGQSEPRA
jgi:ubiquinone biosynthesis protein UbiJ